MDSQNTNSMWIRAYSPDGFEMSLTLAVNSVAEAQVRLDEVRAAGWLPRRPDAGEQGESEVIETVVRRATESGTPIIDYYPAWSNENTFGAFKFAHKYLDTADDIAQFEAQSGLKLGDVPLYEGQQAITRKPGKPTRCETKVRRSFSMKKVKIGQYDDGKPKYEYGYSVPMTVQASARRIDSQNVAHEFVADVVNRIDVISVSNILKCLGIKAFSEWQGTYDEAFAQVAKVAASIKDTQS